MSKPLFLALVLLCSLTSATTLVMAQECSPPAIIPNQGNNNIFTPEQEMVLGELTFQRMSGDLRFVTDPALDEFLNKILEKLVRHLPPTGLKFQIFIRPCELVAR